jgi:ribosomal protein L17
MERIDKLVTEAFKESKARREANSKLSVEELLCKLFQRADERAAKGLRITPLGCIRPR